MATLITEPVEILSDEALEDELNYAIWETELEIARIAEGVYA